MGGQVCLWVYEELSLVYGLHVGAFWHSCIACTCMHNHVEP